jgi:hypothetical protein
MKDAGNDRCGLAYPDNEQHGFEGNDPETLLDVVS